ncbi:CHAT domain-containing protein [Crepidotus variabilis]|uniref:CHAT domain-containing protein n=1 Tax=Crepidotus variabilis TaxID=179855 RepID=A0A9P6JP39_9AGAR|nr:CHAT domain-containing protein [Crepidotus variabilis]
MSHQLTDCKFYLIHATVDFECIPKGTYPIIGSVGLLAFTAEDQFSQDLPVERFTGMKWRVLGFQGLPFGLTEFALFVKSNDGDDMGFTWIGTDVLGSITHFNDEGYFQFNLDLKAPDDELIGRMEVGICLVPPSLGRVKQQEYGRAFKLAAEENPDLLIECLLNIDGDSTLKRFMLNLCGRFYFDQYRRRGKSLDGLNQAIFVYGFATQYNEHLRSVNEVAIDRLSADSEDGDLQREGLEKLSIAYVFSFQQNSSNQDHLSIGISILRLLVQCCLDTSPRLAVVLTNLGNALRYRFESNNQHGLEDIAESVSMHRRALDKVLEPDVKNITPAILVNLATASRSQCNHTFDPELQAEWIFAMQRALELAPEGDERLPTRLAAAAGALERQFKQSKERADILKAIKIRERSVEITSPDDPSRPAMLSGLGRCWLYLYKNDDNVQQLDKSISIHRDAIELAKTHPDDIYAQTLGFSDFGEALMARFMITLSPPDFEEADKVLRMALEHVHDNHIEKSNILVNLLVMHSKRYLMSPGEKTLADVLDVVKLMSTTPSIAPKYRMSATALMANMQLLVHEFEDGRDELAVYAAVIDMLPEVAGLEQRVEIRHKQLEDLSLTMSLGIARAIRQGQIDLAVEWMERIHCWVWNQLNQLRAPLDGVRAHDLELANRIEQITHQLEIAGSRSTTVKPILSDILDISPKEGAHRQIILVKEWNQAIEEVRAIPALHNFLRPPSVANLLASIPEDGPVILFNINKILSYCDAFALLPGNNEPIHIPLKAKREDLDGFCKQLHGYLSSKGVRSRGSNGFLDEGTSINSNERGGRLRVQGGIMADVLRYLWMKVVEPILDALAYSPMANTCRRIWWCATGPLAFLPLHAAGIYGKNGPCLADYAISSYIPTVSTLIEKISKNVRYSNRLLLIAQADAPDLPPIPATSEEVAAVAGCVRAAGGEVMALEGPEATIGAVKSNLSSCSSIHLACHGIQEVGEPLKSGFELRDGRLDLSELIRQYNPHSDLAFLSACQTGVGDEKLPEEMVHLAAGMLAAGYRSVVATSWSIKDAYGPEVALDFYAHLTGGGTGFDGSRSALALHCAVQKLRRKVRDSESGLLTWVPYVHFGA